MNKEPIALYLFRYVMGFGLLLFMAMLYWSSLLLENNVQTLRGEVGQLRRDVQLVSSDLQKMRGDLLQAVMERPPVAGTSPTSVAQSIKTPTQDEIGDKRYPNLLTEDPFYKKTLPTLLGANFKPQGTLRSDSVLRPNNLLPLSNELSSATWSGMCRGSVGQGHFGIYETYAPDLALKLEERIHEVTKRPEFWVFLRRDALWQPLQQRFFPDALQLAPQFLRSHPVTAHDFKLFYDAVMNPYFQDSGSLSYRSYLSDIESVEVVDDYTFVVRWKMQDVKQPDGSVKSMVKYTAKQWTAALQPLPSFVYKYFADGTKIVEEDSEPNSYRTSSVWAQNFAQHWAKNVIVSCGGWVFDGMTDEAIRFKRNTDYYQPLAVLVEESIYTFRSSTDALWQNFKAGSTDTYQLQPEKISEWEEFQKSPSYLAQKEQGQAIESLDYLGHSYTFIGWNQNKPYFTSRKVRQALTMAIDRQRIIDQTLRGQGVMTNGTFIPYSPAYDASIQPWPYDVTASKRLLEEEGWYDSDGDGVIDKEINGKRVPFRFAIIYYVKNSVVKAVAESIVTMLREVGIVVELRGLDVADLTREGEDKSFDALMMSWMLGVPPEDPRQIWHSEGAREKGSSNMISFASPEADRIIEQLSYTYDNQERTALYYRFDAILHEEQPYTFLYAPIRTLLYRSYVQNVFIPAKRQDLIPGANVDEPQASIFWLKKKDT